MIVLGIDPALINTGWALIEYNEKNDACICLNSGLIKISKNLKLPVRLNLLWCRIKNLLNSSTIFESIDVIGVEETIVGINPKNSIRLAQARGVILASISNCLGSKKIIEIPNTKVKKYVTHNGCATKEKVAQCVKLIFGKDCQNDFQTYDISDALAIAYTIAMSYSFDEKNKFIGITDKKKRFELKEY